MANKAVEIVNNKEVKCAGDESSPALGHPLIYLHIAQDSDKIVCPYCSKIFIYETKNN